MLGVVKSIKISRLIALQNKTPVEGKIAWGNHQKDIERMDSPPQQYKERFVTTPRRYKERTVSPVRRYGRVDSPHLPSCRDRHKGPFSQQTTVKGASPRKFGMKVDHKESSTHRTWGMT